MDVVRSLLHVHLVAVSGGSQVLEDYVGWLVSLVVLTTSAVQTHIFQFTSCLGNGWRPEIYRPIWEICLAKQTLVGALVYSPQHGTGLNPAPV